MRLRRAAIAEALPEFSEALFRLGGTVACESGGLVISRRNAGWLVGDEVANVVEPDEQWRCYLALARGRSDMHFVRPYLLCLTTPRGGLYAVDAYNRRVYRLAGGAVCEMHRFAEHATSLMDATADEVAGLRASLARYVECDETRAYARAYLGLLVGVFDFALERRAGVSAGPPHVTLAQATRADAREMVARALLVVGSYRPVVDALFECDDDDDDDDGFLCGAVECAVAMFADAAAHQRRARAQHHARLCLDIVDHLVPVRSDAK
jgi:hypothetical protein